MQVVCKFSYMQVWTSRFYESLSASYLHASSEQVVSMEVCLQVQILLWLQELEFGYKCVDYLPFRLKLVIILIINKWVDYLPFSLKLAIFLIINKWVNYLPFFIKNLLYIYLIINK